jgi:hypothetical protein
VLFAFLGFLPSFSISQLCVIQFRLGMLRFTAGIQLLPFKQHFQQQQQLKPHEQQQPQSIPMRDSLEQPATPPRVSILAP